MNRSDFARLFSAFAFLVIGGFSLTPILSVDAQESRQGAVSRGPWKLEEAELGETKNVHRAGPIWLAGQPSAEELRGLAEKGVGTVITLREEDEIDWDEQGVVESAGMTFVPLRFNGLSKLTDEVFDESRRRLRQAKPGQGVLLHCASANRVGALWLAHRVLDGGLDLETARREASEVGLRSEQLESKALEYIRRKQGE